MGTVSSARRKRCPTRSNYHYQPQLEVLEDRTVPSTIRLAGIGANEGNRAADSLPTSNKLHSVAARNQAYISSDISSLQAKQVLTLNQAYNSWGSSIKQPTKNGVPTGPASPAQTTLISVGAAGADGESEVGTRQGETQQAREVFDGLWNVNAQALEPPFQAIPQNQLVPCDFGEKGAEFGPSPFFALLSSEEESPPSISMVESHQGPGLALMVVPLLAWMEGFSNAPSERERKESWLC